MQPQAPDTEHLATLRAIASLERGAACEIDPDPAAECCAAGWAFPAAGANQFRLTEAGREVLANASALGD